MARSLMIGVGVSILVAGLTTAAVRMTSAPHAAHASHRYMLYEGAMPSGPALDGLKSLATSIGAEGVVVYSAPLSSQTTVVAPPAESTPDSPTTSGTNLNPLDFPTLKLGEVGPAVETLRTILGIVGFEAGTGQQFDADLEAIVKEFQRANGLEDDGVVGSKTWQRMVARLIEGSEKEGSSGTVLDSSTSTTMQHGTTTTVRPESTTTSTTPDIEGLPKLRRGDSGPAVLTLRQRLDDLGYSSGGPDTFDDALDAVVRMFQQDRGLVVDGVVGTQTWMALYEEGRPAAFVQGVVSVRLSADARESAPTSATGSTAALTSGAIAIIQIQSLSLLPSVVPRGTEIVDVHGERLLQTDSKRERSWLPSVLWGLAGGVLAFCVSTARRQLAATRTASPASDGESAPSGDEASAPSLPGPALGPPSAEAMIAGQLPPPDVPERVIEPVSEPDDTDVLTTSVAEIWDIEQFLSEVPRTPQCPDCGESIKVKQSDSSDSYDCAACDAQWRVYDGLPDRDSTVDPKKRREQP